MKRHPPALIVTGAALVYFGVFIAWKGLPASRPRSPVTIQGHPWLALRQVQTLQTEYRGARRHALALSWTVPTALAAADFDEDGMPDLVSGYRGPMGGLVTLHRGNAHALWPYHANAQGHDELTAFPFWPEAQVFELSEPPDFLGAGDVDGDGHQDLVSAAREGRRLHFGRGDGRGGFHWGRSLAVPGRITALAIGEIHRADGLSDLLVGIAGEEGPYLLVFSSPEGALRGEPQVIPLPSEATALALGQVDEGYERDLVIAAGTQLVIIPGRDLKRSSDELSHTPWTEIQFTFPIISLSLGDFIPDAASRTEIALLAEDGTIHILARTPLKEAESSPSSDADREWAVAEQYPTPARSGARRLLAARVLSLPAEDLLVLDAESQNLLILSLGIEEHEGTAHSATPQEPLIASLEIAGRPIAALPLRLNADALADLVILREGARAPDVILTMASQTFTVNSTNDNDDGTCDSTHCSLREAINAANSNPGLDTIAFNISGAGLHTITPVSALPMITDPVTIDGYTQSGASPNTNPVTQGLNTALKIVLTKSGSAGGFDGLTITGGSSTIRGLVINRFRRGIVLSSANNIIEGNFIGTDVAGTTDQGNTQDGIRISGATNNTIGGTLAGARNLISGNNDHGVHITDSGATGNLVQGNLIGTDITGTADLGNSEDGIRVTNNASGNTIGGTASGARNLISGNNSDGVDIRSDGNLVQGNLIGTQINGTSARGNNSHGVRIEGNNNTVGGAGAGNVIAFNGNDGVFVDSGTGNRISQNAIFSNGTANADLGIDLSPGGVTSNDSGDGDGGANRRQNFPVLSVVVSGSSSTTIVGSIDSTTTNSTYPITIEFFRNSSCDTAGHGEGETFLGAISVNGPGSFTATLSVSLPSGSVVTATATDSAGNTSEFSACASVNGTLTIAKTAIGGNGTFSYTVRSGTVIVASPNITTSSGSGMVTLHVTPGSYTVTETVPPGWDFTSLSCMATGGSSASQDPNTPTQANITMAAGGSVTCTYTNTKRGTIVIRKDAVPDDPQDFSFTGSGPNGFTFNGGFALDDDQDATLPNQRTFSDLVPGSYTVTEGVVSGWDLTALSCTDPDNGSSGNIGTRTATIDLDAGEIITCIFQNTKRGTIVVRKVTDPSPDPTDTSFSFSGDVSGSIPNGGTLTRDNLLPGTYTATETVPSNFMLTAISCDDRASANPSSGNVATATATFRLDPGETVTCTFTNRLKQANVNVTKSDSPDPVVAGQNLTYTIAVTNSGPDPALAVQMSDTVPTHTTFQSLTAPSGWSCTTPLVNGTGSITCTTASLSSGATATFTLTVKVTPSAPHGTNVSNTASAVSATFDPQPSNNSATATTGIVAQADLRIQKRGPSSVGAAQVFAYTIEVSNAGPSDAQNVVVSDSLPPHASFVGASGSGWTCALSGSVVTCTRGGLPAGASAPSLELQIRAPAVGDVVRNIASVSSSTPDSLLGNNTSTAETELRLTSLSVLFTVTRVPEGMMEAQATTAQEGDAQGVLVVDSANDQVRVWFNQGDGTLRPGQTFLVGDGPVAAVLGDVNGDGAVDAIAANLLGRSLTVLEGRGDGTFRPARMISTMAQPRALALGDFDRDGRPDLVVAYLDTGQVQFFKGQGDGTFRAGRSVAVGEMPSALVAADLNRDERLDIALADFARNQVVILLGRGDGTFSSGGSVSVERGPIALTATDLEGDGRLELITANHVSSSLSILKDESTAGTPRFRVVATLPTGEGPLGVIAGQWRAEESGIAYVSANAPEVGVYLRDENGRLRVSQRLSLANMPTSLVMGDLNGDGALDLVVSDVQGVARVLLNVGRGQFREPR